MSYLQFKLKHLDQSGDNLARRAQLKFPRGVIETPAFMPVGTYGTVSHRGHNHNSSRTCHDRTFRQQTLRRATVGHLPSNRRTNPDTCRTVRLYISMIISTRVITQL